MLSTQPSHTLAIATSLTLVTERNSTTSRLSSGQNGQPIMEMSICAQTINGDTPSHGEVVTFYYPDPNYSSRITLSPTIATTNGSGKAYITVKSSGGNNNSNIITIPVRAQWEDMSGRIKTADIGIILFTDYPSVANPTPSNGFGPVSPSLPTAYLDTAPGWLSPFTGVSRATWTIPSKISFSSGGSNKILWPSLNPPVPTDPTIAAWTTGPNPVRIIKFNGLLNSNDNFPYPDASHRPSMAAIASHELGHAIDIGHNIDRKSLMYFDTDFYFIWGIQSPQLCDIAYVNATYPQ